MIFFWRPKEQHSNSAISGMGELVGVKLGFVPFPIDLRASQIEVTQPDRQVEVTQSGFQIQTTQPDRQIKVS